MSAKWKDKSRFGKFSEVIPGEIFLKNLSNKPGKNFFFGLKSLKRFHKVTDSLGKVITSHPSSHTLHLHHITLWYFVYMVNTSYLIGTDACWETVSVKLMLVWKTSS